MFTITARRLEVIARVRYGQTTGQIAEAMGITYGTAKRYIEEIYIALNLVGSDNPRVQLAKWYVANYQRIEREMNGRENQPSPMSSM